MVINDNQFELVAFMPNKSIDDYIENITEEDLKFNKGLEEPNKSKEIYLSLPRFTYEFDLDDFINILKSMGIEEVFDVSKADLTNMYLPNDKFHSLYVDEAIHKTKIELTEDGTKAAAATYFGMEEGVAIEKEPKEIIRIEFNKPFIYMIRENNTKEILFFGTVYEPNIWNGSTCSE